MRRFYTDVATNDGAILLDGRPVRTPARAPLVLPTTMLAEAVAAEWRAQGETIDPRAMPLTGLANAAIDRVAPDPAAFARPLAAYGETDLLCYRADAPDDLVATQAEAWDPLLAWARRRYDVDFVVTVGIVHVAQPPETVLRLAAALGTCDAFALAALSPLVTIGGSLVAALALTEGAIAADAAFDLTHLDELWQVEHWGEDALARDTREHHRADFLAAAHFLTLLH
ncbi:ATP12 family chaperone protein [Sphingomonas nostoxanthinifaciens]|uniref:ATP12 family chaperone protein n=1 Tax=Sphingomonas nostoxanthinifaciens TaxID=2872652 RepID=UPI001CC1D176|nr:ATP12 family protein [Sphingomonas nostoxanthinifaciens]UAK26001.1 ATPase [Sphingomonas nostoxanthinifaciens]